MNLCLEFRGIGIRHLVALFSFIYLYSCKNEPSIFIKSFYKILSHHYHHHSKKRKKISAPKNMKGTLIMNKGQSWKSLNVGTIRQSITTGPGLWPCIRAVIGSHELTFSSSRITSHWGLCRAKKQTINRRKYFARLSKNKLGFSHADWG